MLNEIDLAVLGGHFMNDANINQHTALVSELLESYRPDILSDCLIGYDEIDKKFLYEYIRNRVKTVEKALEEINNQSINSLGYGLTEEKLDKINNALNEVNQYYNRNIKIISIDDLINEIHLKKVIPSRNPFLNQTIGTDGFEKGRSYVFASQAKGGKSLFLQNLAQNFDNQKVLYISLENDLCDIYSRSLQMRNSLTVKYNTYDIIYNPQITLEDIKTYCKTYDVVIIDYLARIIPPKELEKESLYTIYGDIADKLHYIANETDTVIITACQLNRSALSVFKGEINSQKDWEEAFLSIDQDSLSDSMGIVRNSDSVSTIWFKNGSYIVHNIASRVSTKEEACECFIFIDYKNKKETIEMTNKGSFICSKK